MTLLHVPKLARGYRFEPSRTVPDFGHVVGPVFGQVYSAQRDQSGVFVELTSIGAGHFHAKHPTAEER
jgi:hypothetical protein